MAAAKGGSHREDVDRPALPQWFDAPANIARNGTFILSNIHKSVVSRFMQFGDHRRVIFAPVLQKRV